MTHLIRCLLPQRPLTPGRSRTRPPGARLGGRELVIGTRGEEHVATHSWVFHTDNGAPGSHGCNWPHRVTNFRLCVHIRPSILSPLPSPGSNALVLTQCSHHRVAVGGQVNGIAFISSPLLPADRHGTKFRPGTPGGPLPHRCRRIAKLCIDVSNTGPIPPDGSISGQHLSAAARHHAQKSYTSHSIMVPGTTPHGCSPSIRQGKWKRL